MTTTGLQVPGLGKVHKVCGGVKNVCARSPPTRDCGTPAQFFLILFLILDIGTEYKYKHSNKFDKNKQYRPRKL